MGELIFIGLGLYDEKDISVRGKDLAKKADLVYSEFYTSNLAGCSFKDIESELGIDINILNRDDVENKDILIKKAKKNKVAFLTGGDPMAATTHIDLRLRAEQQNIPTRIVHSSSIFSAAPSILGVQHYKFGKAITLPFKSERKYPKSPYKGIKNNQSIGLHSLILLDINGEEKRYMSIEEGLEALLELEERLDEGVITEETIMAGLSQVGSKKPLLKAGYTEDLLNFDFGGGLHSMVIFGDLHFMEIDSLIEFADAPNRIKESN